MVPVKLRNLALGSFIIDEEDIFVLLPTNMKLLLSVPYEDHLEDSVLS